jgi:uncharacterized protein DUF6580
VSGRRKILSHAKELATDMPTLRVLLLTSLIVAAALSRLAPHPQNVAPITAMTLFAAAHLPSRRWSVVLPLAAMLLSDVVLYATKDAAYRDVMFITTLWVYSAIVAIAAIGQWLRKRPSVGRITGTTISGSVVFFLMTNFGSWVALTATYPRTIGGLMDCYAAALPFFRNTILGDVVYSGILFGGLALVERAVPLARMAREQSNEVSGAPAE